jgi:hypothetical protein
MNSRVAVAVALLVVTAGIAVTGPVTGATAAGAATPTPTEAPSTVENGTNESQLGASVSAFMQASAAETEGSIDNGMWKAGYARANASERPAMVKNRTAVLERRAARLEAQRAALLNETDGEVTVRERAKAARLAARIDALRDAINATAEAATETGVNRTRLLELREQTGNFSGSEIARMARNLTFGPPPHAQDSPDRPPGADRSGNETDVTGNETGQRAADWLANRIDGNEASQRGANRTQSGTDDGGDVGMRPRLGER